MYEICIMVLMENWFWKWKQISGAYAIGGSRDVNDKRLLLLLLLVFLSMKKVSFVCFFLQSPIYILFVFPQIFLLGKWMKWLNDEE